MQVGVLSLVYCTRADMAFVCPCRTVQIAEKVVAPTAGQMLSLLCLIDQDQDSAHGSFMGEKRAGGLIGWIGDLRVVLPQAR